MKCQDCGVEDDTVGVYIEPYYAEILQIEEEVIVCSACYTERAMEI